MPHWTTFRRGGAGRFPGNRPEILPVEVRRGTLTTMTGHWAGREGVAVLSLHSKRSAAQNRVHGFCPASDLSQTRHLTGVVRSPHRHRHSPSRNACKPAT